MRKIEKNIKILHQGSGNAINIPKIVMQLMNMKSGDSVKLEYDIDREEILIRKVD